MKTYENTVDNYQRSLVDGQHAISEYFSSIGKLFESVERKGSHDLSSESRRWLTLTVQNVIELQKMILQKDRLVRSESFSDLFQHSPNGSSILNQRNITSFHLKSTHYPWFQTKNEPPLKPWLSQKVYRHY